VKSNGLVTRSSADGAIPITIVFPQPLWHDSKAVLWNTKYFSWSQIIWNCIHLSKLHCIIHDLTRLRRWVPLMEHMFLVGSIFSFMCMFCRSLFVLLSFFFWNGGHRMVVGFATTCAISANQHKICEFESRWGVLATTLCDIVCQWIATGQCFFPGTPFPPPIKRTTTI
jgi:hypothetical protein